MSSKRLKGNMIGTVTEIQLDKFSKEVVMDVMTITGNIFNLAIFREGFRVSRTIRIAISLEQEETIPGYPYNESFHCNQK